MDASESPSVHAIHGGAEDMVDEGEIDDGVMVVGRVAETIAEDGGAVLVKAYELRVCEEENEMMIRHQIGRREVRGGGRTVLLLVSQTILARTGLLLTVKVLPSMHPS